MIWLLDTNALIHAARGRPPLVRQRLQTVSPDDVAVSAGSVAELWFGIAKHPQPEAKRKLWTAFLEPYTVLSFDHAAGEAHADIRFALRRNPIGERDLLIAAIARSRGLIVVTNNIREFERVPELRVEDWTVG